VLEIDRRAFPSRRSETILSRAHHWKRSRSLRADGRLPTHQRHRSTGKPRAI